MFAHVKAKNVRACLTYSRIAPRKMMLHKCYSPDFKVEEYLDSIGDGHYRRMGDYVDRRDREGQDKAPVEEITAEVGKVDLQSVVDAILADGCYSFDHWQDKVFMLHPEHDSEQRKMLIRILQCGRSEYHQRAATGYLAKHFRNFDWVESMIHQKPLLYKETYDGKYLDIDESQRWLRKILKFNHIDPDDFINNVFSVCMRSN